MYHETVCSFVSGKFYSSQKSRFIHTTSEPGVVCKESANGDCHNRTFSVTNLLHPEVSFWFLAFRLYIGHANFLHQSPKLIGG